MKKYVALAVLLTIAGLGFRLFLALHLPTDEPDDGRLYARIALNVLDHRSYSIETEEPYSPTLIRVPGYPLFIAGVYAIFGRDNNRAVRVIQALLDTVTCWLIALLALAWAPVVWALEKRRRLLLIALAMAMCCPFLAIYVTTILTETCTTLLATLCALSATLAMNTTRRATSAGWWFLAGIAGGLATMFRPDSGLFVAAVGCTLLLVGMFRAISRWRSAAKGPSDLLDLGAGRIILRTIGFGVMLTIGFAVALGPWTFRNARVFGLFQPIAPAQANMPGEFVPRGYIQWLKTWVDDVKYTETLEWSLDTKPIHIEQVPPYAFDSAEERDRVAALLERYNNPPDATAQPPAEGNVTEPNSEKKPAVIEPKAPEEEAAEEEQPEEEAEASEEDQDAPEEQEETQSTMEMTPEVDAGFAEIASERIARHPLRYYLIVPMKRAAGLWFDTHSQYYPFQGEMLPFADLDSDIHQQYWLPLFVGLTLLYTVLGAGGFWVMWKDKQARRCLLLLGLLIIPRFAFLTTMENPEPRYVVEFFAFVVPVGSIFLNYLWDRVIQFTRTD